LNLSLLEGAKQLWLKLLQRAGQRPGDMAEQLALRNADRKRRAVDVNQRFIGSCGRLVDLPCDELLARTGFAGDEDRQIGASHQADLMKQPRHRGTGPEDVAAALCGAALQLLGNLHPMIRTPFERIAERHCASPDHTRRARAPMRV
jgi:hypothetical protein